MGLNECTFLLLSCINLVKPLQTQAGSIDKPTIQRYNMAINRAAQKYDISPYLLLGILKVESDFGRNTASVTNDHGPMQINRWWFSRLNITAKTVKSPEGSMYVAAKILNYAREDTGGKGCWWSVYNSLDSGKRWIYEKKVLGALASMGFKATCKSSDFLYDWQRAEKVTDKLRMDTGIRLAELRK